MSTYLSTIQNKDHPEGVNRTLQASSLQAAFRDAIRWADAARKGTEHEVVTIRIERTA